LDQHYSLISSYRQ
jgi:hypothetical protein